jgi:hypothetical protein
VGVLRIEKPVQLPAAGLELFCEGRLRKPLLLHRGEELVGEKALNRLLRAGLMATLLLDEAIEALPNAAFFDAMFHLSPFCRASTQTASPQAPTFTDKIIQPNETFVHHRCLMC